MKLLNQPPQPFPVPTRLASSLGSRPAFLFAGLVNAKRVAIALILALSFSLQAKPLTAEEVSLLVRLHETEPFIVKEVTKRKLMRPLTEQQEATLKAQGASESLLKTLRDPSLQLTEAEALTFEARVPQKPLAQQVIPIGTSTRVVPVNLTDAGADSGVDLIIEKMIIQNPPPLPGPFYVWVQVKTGRAEVIFDTPGIAYGDAVASTPVEIPLNLRISNVNLQDWATFKVQVDKKDAPVRTIAALKKSTSRIEITKDPMEKEFIGFRDQTENFTYRLKWHTVQ